MGSIQQGLQSMTESLGTKHVNNDINGELIKKIRGDKLQIISAECDLQICLAFKYGKQVSPIKNAPFQSKQQSSTNHQMQDQVRMLYINNFNVSQRQKLVLMFRQIRNKWSRYKQSKGNDNNYLMKYSFQGDCDLSYILYQLKQTNGEQFYKLTAEDLLFIEFLCLQGRRRLNETIIKYYQENINWMIDMLKDSLGRIRDGVKENRERNGGKRSEVPMADSLDFIYVREEQKTKRIRKEKKQQKNAKIKKDEYCRSQQDGESASESTNYSEEQLALKTCNYISWAYWYIVEKI